jgi:serine/threonine protein kinase
MLHLKHKHSMLEHPGSRCVRQAESAFSLFSQTGEHKCFVFPPLGPSLLEFSRRPGVSFHLEQVRWIATYLLHGVAFLHSRGIVHTGI